MSTGDLSLKNKPQIKWVLEIFEPKTANKLVIFGPKTENKHVLVKWVKNV